jgi:hypothetical protein
MILVALGLLCCTPIGAAKPVAAAVFAGTAAAATGVKRKVVGGCWANCSKGWHCDEQSGLCVEDEERPAEPGMNYEHPAASPVCRPPLRCDASPTE